MKKAFLISVATALTLSAQIVDGVAMTVNGRVVTMFEIVKLSESAKISRQDAIEKIIEKKLEEYELEKQNVKIDDFEIERRMEMIASSNNMSLSQFKEAIEKNFLGVSEYKKELKESQAEFSVDERAMTIRFRGEPLSLTNSEYELMKLFLNSKGKALNRDDIANAIEFLNWDSTSRNVDVLVSKLRSKLDDDPKNPKYIKSVWGIGYKFIGQ